MLLSIYHRTLLRSMSAGVVTLAVATACSRSDRSNTAGRDTAQTGTAVAPSDTQGQSAARQSEPGTTTAPASDTGAVPAQSGVASANTAAPAAQSKKARARHGVSGYRAMERATDTVAVGDSSQAGKPGERLEPTAASQQANADTGTGQSDTARIRPPADSSEALGRVSTDTSTNASADSAANQRVSTDTSAVGYSEMARDTSVALAQGDTSAALEADSATIHAQVDTTTAQQADTTAQAETNADTLASENGRIRPPEDSTEILGQVHTDRAEVSADRSAAGGAAVQSTGNIATGADAVALMTRAGQRCQVVNPDDARDVLWDLASSPATLNPCGTGTMTLPKIWTGEKK
jgi:hypothetical protein